MKKAKQSSFDGRIKSGKAPQPTQKSADKQEVKTVRSSDGQKFSGKSPRATKK